MSFETISKQAWLEKVTKDLKGKSIESLNWESNGTQYSPFFHSDDQAPNGHISNRNDNIWQICVQVNVGDPKQSNAKAKDILMRGANALHFVLDRSFDFADIASLLEGIQLEWISTVFDTPDADIFVEKLSAYVEDTNLRAEKIDLTVVDASPSITQVFEKGKSFVLRSNANDSISEISNILKKCVDTIDSLDITESTCSLESQTFTIRLKADEEYFLNIAKLRVCRMLFSQLFEAYSINFKPVFIESTVGKNTSSGDENMNKISASLQALSSAIGGANRIKILPSDHFSSPHEPSRLNERVALNIHHILQLESHLGEVVDPSAGSYFIEKLTNDLAEMAWNRFRNK